MKDQYLTIVMKIIKLYNMSEVKYLTLPTIRMVIGKLIHAKFLNYYRNLNLGYKYLIFTSIFNLTNLPTSDF